MKKVLVFVLVAVLCVSMCSCFSGAKKITVAEVESKLSSENGDLDMETKGDYVTGFTYTVEEVNSEKMSDKSYVREAIYLLASENSDQITINQLDACRAAVNVMSVVALLTEDEGDFNAEQWVEDILEIACDGKTAEYNGWTVSVSVDTVNDTATIIAKS